MTSSELLHSFLEGELDAALEPSLFSELNTSGELRAEMRDMLAVQRAVKRDRAAIVPPLASTAAVFGALGMSTSLVVSNGWLSGLWSKAWAPLAAAVVSGVVTWYAATPPPPPSHTSMQAAVNTIPERPTHDVLAGAVIHDTVVVTKTQRVIVHEPASDRPALQEHVDLARGAAPATTSVTERNVVMTSASDVPDVPKEIIEAVDLRPQPAAIIVRRVDTDAMLTEPEVVNGTRTLPAGDNVVRPFVRSFMTSLRAINASSYVNVSKNMVGGAGLNNMALGISYTFNEWFGAGIEIGREPCAMSFKGVTDGPAMRYESVQDLTWGSVHAQLTPFPSLRNSGWQPYFQFNGGFTNYGFLTKGLLAATYAPSAHLRMLVGFEATGLFYTVQGTSYTTPKLGFTYGIGYQL
ncbi:MAG: hypothetical protein ACKOB6_00550 [Candidatus Kapaibacterium sp.]